MDRPVHRHGQPPLRRLGAWLAWDSPQRLTQVSTPEHTATYQYDLLGRRVQRQITKPGFPPETTHYVYDGLQAVGEIRPQQSSSSLMTGLNLDEMLARVTTLNATNTTQARTYLTDALGSVMAQTQDNQSTLAGYSYSPYGQTQSTGNTEGDSVQYTGRENDHNGLYYYRARYYDPVLKRFLSEDPIGLAGGSLSFYSYVGGDPISYVDPLGLSRIIKCGSQIKGVKTKTSDRVKQELLFSFTTAGLEPIGPNVGPDLDPRNPRKLPIKPEIELEFILYEIQFWKFTDYRLTQIFQDLLTWCTWEEKDKCGKPIERTYFTDVKDRLIYSHEEKLGSRYQFKKDVLWRGPRAGI